jgi:Cdc6-like AAA superfamily ATPase
LSAQRDRFQVDKEAIFQALQAETQRQACIYCPAFHWRHVRSQVNRLPDELPLGSESPFELKYSAMDGDQPLGIRLKVTSGCDPVRLSGGPDPVQPQPAQLATRRQLPEVRYAEVAGQDAALAAVRNVVELPLAHAEYFQSLGVQPHRSILLYGPPGNGKTLLAKAVASESNRPKLLRNFRQREAGRSGQPRTMRVGCQLLRLPRLLVRKVARHLTDQDLEPRPEQGQSPSR